jgi:hypothetical protein
MSDLSAYVPFPVDTDALDLTTEAFASLGTMQPGWIPHEGQLDVALVEIIQPDHCREPRRRFSDPY